MGDVDHRRGESGVQAGNLGAGGGAELRVEVGERLVKKENFRLAHESAADGDALALTAGEGLGKSVENVSEAELVGGGVYAGYDFGVGDFPELETEGEVLENGEVRVEGVILENHRQVAVLGREVIYNATGYGNSASVRGLETGNESK